VAAAAGLGFYVTNVGKWELRAAVAEADRLDPGWRFEDLEAAREPVSPAENSAPVVLAAGALLPVNWGYTAQRGRTTLANWLLSLPPTKPLDPAEVNALRAELAKVAAALDKARQVADRPRGRYAVAWSADLLGTLMPHLDRQRGLVRLLTVDALLRSRAGDVGGAVRSCRAALNVGRSIGDEPAALSQRVRAACGVDAVRALERTLAVGTLDAQSLQELQGLLADEGAQPFLLRAARADRISYYQSLDLIRTRQFNRASYRLANSRLGVTADEWVDQYRAGRSEAAYLRWSNALVEAGKRPTETQDEALRALPEPTVPLPRLVAALSNGSDAVKLARSFNLALAEFRCAAAALAAERYRLAEHRWPERLEDLVPRYLGAVPADPFDGQPLRLRRLPDGLVIFSAGPRRADDRGKPDRKNPDPPGTDPGFRLWDGRQVPGAPGIP
jgi:hypothetical protein